MKKTNPFLITACGIVSLIMPATAAIISQDGSLYTSVSGSPGAAGGDFGADNLFDQNLNIGDDPGSDADSGRSWAANATNPVVEFELDQVYIITDLVYGQRQFGNNQDRDKHTTANIWASETTAFTLTPPAGPADASIALNFTTAGDTFTNYNLSAPITGRYFYIQFIEAPNSGNTDPTGGSELRFQGDAVPEPSSALLASLSGLLLLRRRR
ncbi:hypothetical protein NT6N_16070 [Oceaniferula spumae]|uniref:PEP-CTERM protein-sorting domain-containing protein n=1 Tax=Oceaniferula spumae TaxID=2979115 RepID=A0AAT9FKT4_9BACT